MSDSTKKVHYMSEEQIAMKVVKLNPGKAGIYSFPNYKIYIRSLIPAESLILPEGCYYNTKNGITNKHNTIEGFYATLQVRVD